MRLLWTATALGIASTACGQGFVTPDQFGWQRGDEGTSFYHWDDFSTATGDNTPDIAAMPAAIESVLPVVRETSGGGFLTSTGNIYSITGVVAFEIVVPVVEVAGGTTTVVLQTETLGREIDQTTLFANGEPATQVIELFREGNGSDEIFGGFQVKSVFVFEVPSVNPVLIEFEAEDTSLSLDKLLVDTRSAADACPADTNGDGAVTPADFNAWITAFNSQSAACDQNGDGLCSPADFNAWISNFNSGC